MKRIIDDYYLTFNFKNLIENQYPINIKFPNPNRGRKLIDIYDSMAGQVIEEIFEFNNERKECKDYGIYELGSEKMWKEFVDILMYIGSLWIEVATSLNIDIEKFFKENDYENIKIIDKPDIVVGDVNSISGVFLGEIRRKIYDRKYHKPTPEKPVNYDYDLLNSIINISLNDKFIKNNLNYILTKYRKLGAEYLNIIILQKEKFISSL